MDIADKEISQASDVFVSVLNTLQTEGVVAARRLAASYDQAGQSSLLEADLLAGTGTSADADREDTGRSDGVSGANRYLRCALFARGAGRADAARDFFALAAQALAPENAIRWAIWLKNELRDDAAALSLLDAVAAHHPADARAQWQIACALAGRSDEAARKLREIALSRAWLADPAVDPALPLQLVLERRFAGDWAAVERVCAEHLARHPGDAEISWQLAGAQWRRHDPAAAEATMRVADAVNPGNGNVATALAQFVAEQARFGAARRLYERAYALNRSPTAALDLAELELRKGEWTRGWARYEARLTRTDREPNSVVSIMARVAPHWTGQSLKGRTLLVYSEQGNGDDIQMLRFVPTLAARVREEGGHLVLACRRPLHSLFARYYSPCLEIEPRDYTRHGTPDYCLPMMSVPFALRLKPNQVHGAAYLTPDAAAAAAWQTRVRSATPNPDALQIGITWRGNPQHRRDAQRSMRLEALLPVLAVQGVVFHPLTPGHTQLPAGVPCCDLTGFYPNGFDDVAAHVAALDAIVTIDSAPLHLGGALGVPVFAMLDHISQWAWGVAETQRWYDSVELFRQPRPGEWQPVVERVAARLRALVAAGRQA